MPTKTGNLGKVMYSDRAIEAASEVTMQMGSSFVRQWVLLRTLYACHGSASVNQTRLRLFALAYNLANFLRRLALPRDVRHWSLTTLREKLVKIGAKVTRHSKYVTFQLAEVAVTRSLFAAILDRIARLAIPPPLG